jgi:VWFA-related protein
MANVASIVLTGAVVCAAFGAGSAIAQRTETPRPPQLVRLNVVAVDSHGDPVDDLAKTDLQVFDNGKPEEIVSFRHDDSRVHRAAALAPGEFSNRTGNNIRHATVILFDLLNEHMGARGNSWNELIHYLQPLEASEGLYLYLLTLEGRLYPVHGLPNPEAKDTPDPGGAPWTQQAKPLLDQAMKNVFRTRPIEIEADIDLRERLTYAALASLAARMEGIPGRKNIVWITHGIPVVLGPETTVSGEPVDYTPYLRSLSARLDRANVSIYPVQQVPPGMAMPGDPEARHSGLSSEDTLQQFARYTGGRSQNAAIDIRAAIKAAMNDVRTSYQIAFAPAPQSIDGKFHKLRVTCARKGVRIQAKEGYYAARDDAPSGAEQQEAMDAATGAQFDAAEIGLNATRSPGDKQPNATQFRLRIDPADLQLTHTGGAYDGQVQVRIVTYMADDKTATSNVVSVPWHFTDEQRDRAMKDGLVLYKDMALAPAVQKVRFVILDPTSNAVGSLTIPVK